MCWSSRAIYNQDGERISGTTLLINSPFEADQVWDHLPAPMQAKTIDYDIALYAINANEVARTAGLGGRTNTVLGRPATSRDLGRAALRMWQSSASSTPSRRPTHVSRWRSSARTMSPSMRPWRTCTRSRCPARSPAITATWPRCRVGSRFRSGRHRDHADRQG